jgi:hypothetical protein
MGSALSLSLSLSLSNTHKKNLKRFHLGSGADAFLNATSLKQKGGSTLSSI